MKTIKEFIQRLQNDPEFEQMAQAYETSEEFMKFVQGEGYDFTLDQLLDEFNHEQQESDQPVEIPPAPRNTVEDFIQRLENDPEFERKARGFENNDAFLEFVQSEGYDFTLDQLTDGFKKGKELSSSGEDTPLAPQKATIIPLSRISGDGKVVSGTDPYPNHTSEGQQRPGALYPEFEGRNGGRRRGMKWRSVDSNS